MLCLTPPANEKPGAPVEIAGKQVVTILKSMQPLEEWCEGVTRDVSELLGEKKLEERLEEIKNIIKRMNTHWDHGFFADEQDFLAQRRRLQQEMK